MLLGRERELDRIESVLAQARAGRAGALLLVGAPGMGKTALLDEAAVRADGSGMRVVRLVALEAESGIPAAGMGILLPRLDADAASESVTSVLDALVRTSEAGPLLVTVDDVQWLDEPTVHALAFAARRLLADPVALLLASRPGPGSPALSAFPVIDVPALGRDASRELLRSLYPAMTTERADEVGDALGRVPLPLVEVGHLLDEGVLRGVAPLPSPTPVSAAVQGRYARGFAELAEPARLLLVLLAADDQGDPSLVFAAMERLGLPSGLWEAAEGSGLVRLGPSPAFVHPLARASVHSAADPTQRRLAHRALGEVLRARGEDAAAVRHLAAAATGPDPGLCEELRRLAEHEAGTGTGRGRAAALALMGAELAGTPHQRELLQVLAAECLDGIEAAELAERVAATTRDPALLARCTFVRVDKDDRASTASLVELTRALDRVDLPGPLAVQHEVASVWAAMYAADVGRLEQIADRSAAERLGDSSWQLLAALGMAFTFIARHDRAVPLLLAAQRESASVDPATLPPERAVDWAIVPGWLGDDADHHDRFARLDAVLRASRRPEHVAGAAFFSAERARREGDWIRAEALLTEAIELRIASASPAGAEWSRLASLLACQGEEQRVQEAMTRAEQAFAEWPVPWHHASLSEARGALALALGRPADAVTALEPLRGMAYLGRGARDSVAMGLSDLVEAYVAVGRSTDAREVTATLDRLLDGVFDPYGPAVVARCRALGGPPDADEQYALALEHLGRTSEVFQVARTELLYGEQLRRTGRPTQARAPLARAAEGFERTRTGPWLDRARRELVAAGARPPRRTATGSTADGAVQLTAQELRVALTVTEGRTNAEVASALFLSVKTVEYHLGNVFRKLQVRSRGGLAAALARNGQL